MRKIIIFFLISIVHNTNAQDLTPFRGGGNDGSTYGLEQTFDPVAYILKFTPFAGSNTDGYASDSLYSFDRLGYIAKFSPYAGSQRDGYSKNFEVFTYSTQTISCNGDSILYTIDGQGGAPNYVGVGQQLLGAGTYTFTLTDANGYTASTALMVTEPTPLQANTSFTPIQCYGNNSTVTVTATGGTPNYSGDNIYIRPAGVHTFLVTDSKNCKDTAYAMIAEPDSITTSISINHPIVCNGDTTSISVSAIGGTGSISNAGVFTQYAGNNMHIVTDVNGCSDTVSYTITEPLAVPLTINTNLPVHKYDSLLLSAVSTAVNYIWYAPDSSILSNSNNAVVYNVNHANNSGIYTVVVTDTNNCSNDTSIQINVLGMYAHIRAFLGGAYVSVTGKMHDSLRKNNLIPLSEPYSSGTGMHTAFTHVNGGGNELTDTVVLNRTGDSAIVDWVFLQLRDPFNPESVVATKAALIRRDGWIVEPHDGYSPVNFKNTYPSNYIITIKHRNHFGVQSANALLWNDTLNVYDFTDTSIALYTAPAPNNTNLPYRLTGAKRTLWAGDMNKDRKIRYNGIANDRLSLLGVAGATATVAGYLKTDINMDGKSKYNGINNDRLLILQNSGTTSVINEQTSN